ncbi:MAG: CRISPR-associated helicase Cas3' [Candidatus Fimadaptatus sp.]
MKYLAHISEDGREQSLKSHLTGTAERCREFADPFGAGELAGMMGMLHDIGKYSDAFQRRIRGQNEKVDHSTAGAQQAYANIKYPAVTYCIAGHHGGLPDGGSRVDAPDQTTLCGRLKRQIPPYDAFSTEVQLAKAQPHRTPNKLGEGGFTAALWTRMLFSCLVDADFLDTEAFMQGGAPARGREFDAEVLLARLESHIAPWWDAQTELNRTRCRILRACLDAGAQQPGLFTLTVPTGSGKTVSSLAFALRHARAHGKRRVIYVVPFTSIIEQTAAEFRRILGDENVLEHHSNVNYDDDEDADGEQRLKKLATENWDMPVIVTTAVQFFESLFADRPSRCRKLHNLVDSVIIFDEAQTIPIPYLKPCVWAIAELTVNYGATCVLCTATQPALGKLFQEAAPGLNCREIAPVVDRSVFKRVTYRNVGKLDDDELAARLNAHGQVLCVVGTRRQAQEVYSRLSGEGSFHLSTLMTPNHRRAVLDTIRQRLKDGLLCRVVSTSLIEAGVDVDFPTVYRAEAGLDSVVQAAGRCNREGKRPADESIVYIFQPDNKYIKGMPHALGRPLAVAQSAKRDCDDWDSEETIRRYFTQLYQVDDLDSKAVVKQLEEGRKMGSFPFRSVGEKFRIIQSDAHTVFIPRTDDAQIMAQRLLRGERSRALMRQAAQESVGVYSGHYEALLARGALEVLDEGIAVLTDMALYSEHTGLKLLEHEEGLAFFE